MVADARRGFRREKVAAGGLEEFQHRLVPSQTAPLAASPSIPIVSSAGQALTLILALCSVFGANGSLAAKRKQMAAENKSEGWLNQDRDTTYQARQAARLSRGVTEQMTLSPIASRQARQRPDAPR